MKRLLAAALLVSAAYLVSQPAPPERVGPLPGGGFLLNSGWTIRPAGEQIPLSTLPMSSAVSRDGKYVLILQAGYMPPTITSHDATTMRQIASLPVPDAWLGLTFAPASSKFYIGGGSKACVYEFELLPDGRIEPRRTFTFVAEAQRKHTDFIGDVAVSPDGRMLYAAALLRDSVFVVNLATGIVIEEWKTLARPYRLVMHPSGKAFYVTGMAAGAVALQNADTGALLTRDFSELEPMDMVWSAVKPAAAEDGEPPSYQARLFVASGGSNLVSVFAVSEDASLKPLERINIALSSLQPAGSTPGALALSPDEKTLFVVCSDLNAVAVVDVSAARSVVRGFIPAGWYPTAARVLSDGRLLVLNGRGLRSFANPKGPNPTQHAAPMYLGNTELEYVGGLQRGTASLIPPFDEAQLEAWTKTVYANSPFREELMLDARVPAGNPIPSQPGDPSPIQHVIYIVKENRSYDQVLGDLGIGNGDPSLTLFGQEVTPNLHQIARDFVLLDNFYVSADVSADGHNWSSAAIAPPYVQRMWPNSYGGRRKHYDYEGSERAAQPPAGRIWNNALLKGLTVRNLGWWIDLITPAPASGPQVAKVRDPQLAPYTNMNYRGFDLNYQDVEREKVFAAELKQWEAAGKMPDFTTVRLPNDHTSGVAPGKYSPKAAAADNDLAVGRLVDAVSHSRFWASTAIFILEDDAQNGPDHVDSHRSPAYIVSPYTRARGVDSTMYNTTSMLRTMELILGLRPMTVFDASARPMWNSFRNQPDPRPFEALPARYSIDERNPPSTSADARHSAAFDLDEADRIDDDEMNALLWRSVKGSAPPPPVRSFFARRGAPLPSGN
jgi:DNA-binding beta-propeller fold protein YncE/phospholipase C